MALTEGRVQVASPRRSHAAQALMERGEMPGRHDRGRASGGDGIAALAGVDGAIGGDAGDLLLGQDMVAQFGQHGRLANVAGGAPTARISSAGRRNALRGPFLIRLAPVDADVDLAPDPPFGTAVPRQAAPRSADTT